VDNYVCDVRVFYEKKPLLLWVEFFNLIVQEHVFLEKFYFLVCTIKFDMSIHNMKRQHCLMSNSPILRGALYAVLFVLYAVPFALYAVYFP